MLVQRIDALQLISQEFPNDPVVFTCGSTCREMAATDRRENHLYVVDSMGLVSSIVLGLSLGMEQSPGRRVVGVEGDGGMLMNLNSLATIGYLQPSNLLLVLLDNESYASTGGQATFTTQLDLAGHRPELWPAYLAGREHRGAEAGDGRGRFRRRTWLYPDENCARQCSRSLAPG